MLLVVAAHAAPIVLAFVLMAVQPVPEGTMREYLIWLFYFPGLGMASLALAVGGVRMFHSLTPELEDMLTDRGRRAYDQWSDVWTSTGTQLLAGFGFSGSAAVALLLASQAPGVEDTLYVSPASVLAVLVSAFFISGGAYWIIAGTVLSVVLTQPGRLNLNWYAPVATPGIELLARCYRFAFYGSCVGVFLCLLPILSWAYRVDDSMRLDVVKFSLFVVSLATTLAIAAVPQWHLTRVVAAERRRAIREVTARLPSDPARLGRTDEQDAFLVGCLQTLSTSPTSTVSQSAIVGVLLGLAAAVTPYAIQVVLG